ncbi:MAG TPA: UvrD-helicase domain-containing protein [Methylophilaceae bacterium]|nr:UvrD-helicase domain-containing protein [Methylophilaceae bacterium]
MLREDAHSREQALAPDSFIVEAPAGAGKTELLTQRYLKLLQQVDDPEEIIAITFTNKAASEMRVRILDSLQLAANGVSPAQPHKQVTYKLGLKALQRSADRGWRLLDNPSRLRIYTIDSLSSNLARQMPLLSRFGAQPGVRDDASLYYEEAATNTLDLLEDPQAGEIIRRALQYFDNDTYKLGGLLANMLRMRDQWLNYTQGQATAEAAEAALQQMLGQDLQAAAHYLSPRIQQALMPIARYAASNLACEEPIALLRDWETVIPPEPIALPMWRALADLLLTGSDHKGGLRKALNKNQGLPATDAAKPYKAQLTEILDTLRDTPGAERAIARLRLLPEARHGDEAWQIIATLGDLLNIAVAQLWFVFQAHGEVDFVEIAQRALRALKDDTDSPTDLALKLDYRIQHLLVDEFQDTSPTQIKLLKCLTSGWVPGDGRTLFLVGDPMQSIYRFRKANVGLFLSVAREGIGDVALTPLRLWRNNRSCPPVVDWVNHAFSGVFPAQDSVRQGAIAYRPFVATKANETDEGVQVHALVSPRGDDANQEQREGSEEDEATESSADSLNDVRQREANVIIDIIQQTRAQDPKRKIAVLVRARNHLHALVTEIRRNHPNLSFQAVEIEELANRQIVQDHLSLTNALHHRADRLHWLAILRAPWCGLTLADLDQLVGGDRYSTIPSLMEDEGRLERLSDDGRARLLHLREVMQTALAQRGRQRISRWVHGVWLMLGGPDCLWEAGDVRDVQAFFARIAQLEATGQFTTELLATEVKKLYAAPDTEADERLQFMTIHKSKGLEFDTVILPGLDRKTGNGDQPLLLWEEVPREAGHDASQVDLIAAPVTPQGSGRQGPTLYSYLPQLESERALNEDARVLYVAVTRAERCLHLVGVATPNSKGELKPAKGTFLELLWPQVHMHFAETAARPVEVGARMESSVALADFVPQLVRLASPGLPALLRSPTAVAVAPSRRATADAGASAAPDNETNTQIGILLHRYVELIAREGLAAWPLERVASLKAAMRHWLARQGVAADAIEPALQRVIEGLRATLQSEDGQWVLQARETGSVEQTLISDGADGAKQHVMDRTFIEQGVRWIVDYKSTLLDLSIAPQALQAVAEQHRPQLARYAALFEEEGLPVRTAVFFLSIGRLVELA